MAKNIEYGYIKNNTTEEMENNIELFIHFLGYERYQLTEHNGYRYRHGNNPRTFRFEPYFFIEDAMTLLDAITDCGWMYRITCGLYRTNEKMYGLSLFAPDGTEYHAPLQVDSLCNIICKAIALQLEEGTIK